MVKNILVNIPSKEFVKECDVQFDINLSLITARSLVNILDGFKKSNLQKLPYQLLMKDVLITDNRILQSIIR